MIIKLFYIEVNAYGIDFSKFLCYNIRMTQGHLKHQELFSPEMLELQGQANEFDEFFDKGRASVEIDQYGIYNSAGFRREAKGKVAHALKQGRPVGMIFGDLDGLKAVNDELGHPVGDAVIDRAKAVIKSLMEEFDVPMMAGRMGGDEFAILIEGDEEQTQMIAEEFRNRYGEDVEKPENGTLKERGLAFSVGYSNLSDEDVTDFSSLLRHADLNMYEDKESKMGKLTPEQELGLLAAKNELDTSDIRLRDAPKLWRQRGLL